MAEQDNGKRPLSDTEGVPEPLQDTAAPPAQKRIRQEEGPNAPQQAPAAAPATAAGAGTLSADPKLQSHPRPQQPQNPPPQQQQQQRPQPRPQAPPPTQQQQQIARISSRDHAFFGTVVIDDVVRTVADFLKRNCNHEHVEVSDSLSNASTAVMICCDDQLSLEKKTHLLHDRSKPSLV